MIVQSNHITLNIYNNNKIIEKEEEEEEKEEEEGGGGSHRPKGLLVLVGRNISLHKSFNAYSPTILRGFFFIKQTNNKSNLPNNASLFTVASFI